MRRMPYRRSVAMSALAIVSSIIDVFRKCLWGRWLRVVEERERRS
jgi:hypothetical protein